MSMKNMISVIWKSYVTDMCVCSIILQWMYMIIFLMILQICWIVEPLIGMSWLEFSNTRNALVACFSS